MEHLSRVVIGARGSHSVPYGAIRTTLVTFDQGLFRHPSLHPSYTSNVTTPSCPLQFPSALQPISGPISASFLKAKGYAKESPHLTTAFDQTMAAEPALKAFFGASHFAVVGASSDPTKFGHKSSFFNYYSVPLPSIYTTILLDP